MRDSVPEAIDWRAMLREFRAQNPPTVPDELRQLREEFVRRFPKEQLGHLTLEQYALGHPNSTDSFCYWLEYKTVRLGSAKGGSVGKFGVWFDKRTGDGSGTGHIRVPRLP